MRNSGDLPNETAPPRRRSKVAGPSGTFQRAKLSQRGSSTRAQPNAKDHDLAAILAVLKAAEAGDFTAHVAIDHATGTLAEIAETINQIIGNIRDTTSAAREQDWLKTNLAKFTAMMQGQRSIEALAALVMSELTPLVSAQQGAFYVLENESAARLSLVSSYALDRGRHRGDRCEMGEGLVGQCAFEKKTIFVEDVPPDYVKIASGLGSSAPRNIIVLPVLFEGQLKAVIELASFQWFTPIRRVFLEQLMQSIGVVFNMIAAGMRTEELLQELQRSNAALGARSRELEEKATELEAKNCEIARASTSLQEKARELARTSKYKSDFLANMSHELRTPLNSLLILARLLADNDDGALGAKQVEYAKTICSAGNDLLSLINEILDLSKIEAGKVEIHPHEVSLAVLREYLERSFRQVAQQKGLEFRIRIAEASPQTITADLQRLRQILRNLLSNAFKFTQAGRFTLDIDLVGDDEPTARMPGAPPLLSFAVSDSGIGIAEDKQHIIFEAFQQADPSTSRTYGGTGLGLTISRELARLLGGEIRLVSTPGRGSTFTLLLPIVPSDTDLAGPRTLRERSLELVPHGSGPSAADLKVLYGKRILVVDDDPRNVFAITSLFGDHGATVVAAEDAAVAIRGLEQDPDVDLILMDIMLPKIDGYEATRRIRKLGGFRKLPIVALTAKTMPGDQARCLEAGCDDFVAKPVDNARLIAVVGHWLRAAGAVPSRRPPELAQ